MDPKLWVMEPKIDGWRIRMEVDSSMPSCETFTRTEHDATGKMFKVEFELLNTLIGLKRCVFDGEVVFLNQSSEPDFALTAGIMGSGLDVSLQKQEHYAHKGDLHYIVFDVFEFDGVDMRDQSYDTRRQALESVFWMYKYQYVKLMPSVAPSLEMHQAFLADWGEGSILKYRGAPYEGKRTKFWLKWKNAPDADVIIMGFKPGEGKYEGQVGAIMFGQVVDGPAKLNIKMRGYCSGMTDSERHWITEHQSELIGTVMAIKTFGILSNEGFRHPQFLRFREDKDPMECDWTSK
jgi:bifunctional non-homologous end joining protein LigD